MYPSTPTHTEELIKHMQDTSPKLTEIIKELLEAHSLKVSKYQEGVKYYFGKGDITKREIQIYNEAGQKQTDQDATNNKLASGWHKLLVDQKTSYLVGDPVTVSSKSGKNIDLILDVLGEDFEDALPELVKNASNKGREWLHPFIDEESNFDMMIIPAEEGIPIYDHSKRKNLIGFIRFYSLDDSALKIELWDKENVTYFEQIDGEIVLDALQEVNPAPHYEIGEEGYGWGEVPFIEFANNEERVSDLTFYKQYVDAFDLLMSDVTNTLEDIQSFIYVLKGYEGQSLKEFINDVKRYKVIRMSDEQGSGVDTLNAEVPVEATSSHLEKLIEGIYRFGQGVNLDTDKFGNAPSGIALKFLFSLLDMKASVLERKFSKSLEWLMWFVSKYLEISKKGTFDYKDLKFTFNKSILVNEMELVTMAQQSKGVISNETIVANHPWVTDVEAELERLKEDADEYAKLLKPLSGKGNSDNEMV